MKRSIVVMCMLFLVVGGLCVNGCAPQVTSPTKKAPVKIANIVWLGAELKTVAYPFQLAAKLAEKQVNDRGGILGGREVEVLFYEQGYTGEAAVAAAKKAMSDGCVGIAGYCDATLAVAAQSVLANTIPWIAGGPGTGELYQNPGPAFGNSCCPGSAAIKAMGRWIESNGFKRVVYIGFDSKFCIESEQWLREIWDRPDSKTKLLKSMFVPMTASQLKLEATEAVSLNPDFVFLNLWGDAPLLSAVGTMRELGSNASWTMVYNLADDRTMSVLGPKLSNGSWQEFFWVHDPSVSANNEFYQAYKEFTKNEELQYQEPGAWAVINYEAVMPMLLAFDKAGTTSDLNKFSEALHSLNWVTPHGAPLEVLPNGQFYFKDWWEAEYQDGKWVNRISLPLSKEDYY
ncbi:MAG: ABC transporter substrate-binding protein [Dehalococcoidia bacterium]|nr:ABC transporter substrate-binding protein [Dehalococcoidia bacterium]